MARRPALEQGGGSPEGYRGWLLDGPLRLFWVVGSLCPGPRPRGAFIRGLWICLFAFYYFRKGRFFPIIRGTLWPSPKVAPEPLLRYP
jgi:hypothetical protein